MFGIRTPAKKNKTPVEDPQNDTKMDKTECLMPKQAEESNSVKSPAGASQAHKKDETFSVHTSPTPSVRKSIGEWESGKPDPQADTVVTPKKVKKVELPKPKPKATTSQTESKVTTRGISTEVTKSPPSLQRQNNKASTSQVESNAVTLLYTGLPRVVTRGTSVEVSKSPPSRTNHKLRDRLEEAKQCLIRAKTGLGNARNLKNEIKIDVTAAVEKLYLLVKEGESVKGKTLPKEPDAQTAAAPEKDKGKEERELIKRMEEHAKLIEESNTKMEKLKETIERHQEAQERQSYASVASTFTRRQPQEQTALHSIVVTAKDDQETGEDVLNRIRKVVNAKDGGIAVEKVRKAKDRKVIVGCRTEEEREKVKERLKQAENHLSVQEIKNKDPLVILKDVLNYNSDDDVLKALKKQNPNVFEKIHDKDQKMEIAFKRRTRNPHTRHIVMRVSPKVWQQLVRAEIVKVDLQHVRVADQSPLVQCSLCLGYGHGRRFCKETIEKCSHCGGPHVKAECADWLADVPPACCNCKHAKLDRADHNAFSSECVIRRKWEAIARSTVAYQC